MNKLFLFAFLVLLDLITFAQKPHLTDTTFKAWTEVTSGVLSNNGSYVMYNVENKPINSNTLVVKSTNNSWVKEYTNFSNPNFSGDSRYLFLIQNNKLVTLELGGREIVPINNCNSYELYNSAKSCWLIYRNDSLKDLFVKDSYSGTQIVLSNVEDYIINRNKGCIFWKSVASGIEQLNCLNLDTRGNKTIYNGRLSSNLIFDHSGNKIAFTTSNNYQYQIWYYDIKLPSAILIADNNSLQKGHHIATDVIWNFSSDGMDLFFTQSKDDEEKDMVASSTVWSYKDAFLSQNYKSTKSSLQRGLNLSILNIKMKTVRQLLRGTQKLKDNLNRHNSDILVVESSFAKANEIAWNPYSKPSYYLCYTKTGKLISIKESSDYFIDHIQLSPDNNYLLYYDPELRNYVSLNLKTQRKKIISENLKGGLSEYLTIDRGSDTAGAAGIIGWISGSHQVVIQGTFDLWKLNLDNNEHPINLTNGIGNNNRIIFSMLVNRENQLDSKQTYWVQGFDLNTKSCSLSKLNLADGGFETVYTANNAFDLAYTNGSLFFQQSANSNGNLLLLGGGFKSPNYYFTKNFDNIVPISDNHPEDKYNGMKCELIKYNDKLGRPSEAVLYRPENFDSTRKYPVIFNYYLDMTSEVNRYKSPSPSAIGFNIPVLVSQGYIICQPNIYRIKGSPGRAALNSVLAAVDYLSNFDWIDSSKMGIIGHSLGGFETNYIVTHTDRFKAVVAVAAPSNMIDLYNETFPSGGSAQHYVAKAALVMGVGLEKGLNEYIENSPILYSQDLKTPLLLFHNPGDLSVSFEHSKKFFIQLRSLQKPVWLLQYKNESHTLSNEDNRIDAQNKIEGFFDTFLKNKTRPNWMIEHIKPTY